MMLASETTILSDPELRQKPPKADSCIEIAKVANTNTQKIFDLSTKQYIKAVITGVQPAGILSNRLRG